MLVNQTLDSRARVFAEVKRASLRKDRASPLRTSMLRQTERTGSMECYLLPFGAKFDDAV